MRNSLSILVACTWFDDSTGTCASFSVLRHVSENDVVWSCEEWIGDLDLESLRFGGALRLLFTSIGVGARISIVCKRRILLAFLFVLFQNLILGLLEFIITVVQNLCELEWNFRVAFAGECVEDFGKLSLGNDGILDFTDCLITEDDVSLVNT